MGRGQLACLVLILCHVIITAKDISVSCSGVLWMGLNILKEPVVPPSSVWNVTVCSLHRALSRTDTAVRL